MTNLRFDHGTDGANISVANSGGEDSAPLTHIILNNSSTPSGNSNAFYSTAAAYDGPIGVRIILAAGVSYLRRDEATPGSRWGLRIPFEITSAAIGPSVLAVASIRNPAGLMLAINVDINKKLEIVDNSNIALGASKSIVLPTAKYFVELAFELETTAGTATGPVAYKIVSAADNSLVYEWSGFARTGSASPSQWRFGGAVTGSGRTHVDIDSVRYGELASGWFGPMPSLASPPEIGDLSSGLYRIVSMVPKPGPIDISVTPNTGVLIGEDFVALPIGDVDTSYEIEASDTATNDSATKTVLVPAASEWEMLVCIDGVWLEAQV